MCGVTAVDLDLMSRAFPGFLFIDVRGVFRQWVDASNENAAGSTLVGVHHCVLCDRGNYNQAKKNIQDNILQILGHLNETPLHQ